jgi:hypothetical protein
MLSFTQILKSACLLEMKIVSFNVNGLRPRAKEFGGLKKLLDALDADIICLQVSWLSWQDQVRFKLP